MTKKYALYHPQMMGYWDGNEFRGFLFSINYDRFEDAEEEIKKVLEKYKVVEIKVLYFS